MTDATETERTERCELCRSWQTDNNADTITGTCHRHAPRPAKKLKLHWPRTDADEWCSEFQLQAAPPPV